MELIERYLSAIQPLLSGLIVAGLFIVGIVLTRVLTRDGALRQRLSTPLALILGYLPIAGLSVLARLYVPAAYFLVSIIGLFVLSLAVVLALAAALFDYFIRRYTIDVPKIVRDIVVIIVYAITIIVVLGQHGVNLTGIITTSAVLTAVIGFALQDLLSNLISGLAIQLEQPFRVGDWIQAENLEGRVREVNWRTTKMETRDADIVIVPNNVITRATLINRSAPSGVHRCKMSIGLRYEEPPNRVKEVLLGAIADVAGALKEPAPTVRLKKYDDFSIAYVLHFYIDGYEQLEELEDRVYTLVWYRLARAGMSVPFPIRDLNVRQVSEREVAERRDAERKRIQRALSQVSFLEPLSSDERARLAERVERRFFAVGEPVVRQGEIGEEFFIVVDGELEIRVGRSMRPVGKLTSGQFFGEYAMMTGETRGATVVPLRDSVVYAVGKSAFEELIRANHSLIEKIAHELESRQTALQAAAAEEQDAAARAAQRAEKTGDGSLVRRLQRLFGYRPEDKEGQG